MRGRSWVCGFLPICVAGSVGCGPDGASAVDTGLEAEVIADGQGRIPCSVDAAAFSALSDEGTSAGPVRRVRWQTDLEGATLVRFTDGAVVVEAPEEVDGGSAVLVGAGAFAPVSWQVQVGTGPDALCSPIAHYDNDGIIACVPEITLARDEGAPDPAGLVLTPLFVDDGQAGLVFDTSGRVIWSAPQWCLGPRMVLARGGDALLSGCVATSMDLDGVIVRYGLDGEQQESVAIRGGHTDFVELPDGTLAMLGWDIREFDGRRLLGDTIVELATDGTLREVWNIFNDYVPDLSRDWFSDFDPADTSVEDWSHVNGIEYDAAEDAYYVTAGNLSQVVKVDRTLGQQVWSVGATEPTLATPEGLIDNPHSVQHLDDGTLLVFNRAKEGCSSVVHFRVDEAAGSATEIDRYETPDCLHVVFLGEARRTATGSTLISWSSAGRLQELGQEGENILQADVSLGGIFGFVATVATLYGAP